MISWEKVEIIELIKVAELREEVKVKELEHQLNETK
jgi:hypothetical protein